MATTSFGEPTAPIPTLIHHRHDWPIIIGGGTLLCIHAGWLNAVTLFSLGSPVAHMSGHFTNVGIHLEQARWYGLAYVLGILISFFFGCMLSGFTLGGSKFKAIQPYGKLLLIMSIVECTSTLLLVYFDHDKYLVYPLAFSCGIQNALCTTWSGAVVRTTHFTGMITDTGLVLGHWFRVKFGYKELFDPEKVELWKLMLFLPMMAGFTFGGFMGTLTYSYFDYKAVLFPGVFVGFLGVGYKLIKHKSRYFAFYRHQAKKEKQQAQAVASGLGETTPLTFTPVPPQVGHESSDEEKAEEQKDIEQEMAYVAYERARSTKELAKSRSKQLAADPAASTGGESYQGYGTAGSPMRTDPKIEIIELDDISRS